MIEKRHKKACCSGVCRCRITTYDKKSETPRGHSLAAGAPKNSTSPNSEPVQYWPKWTGAELTLVPQSGWPHPILDNLPDRLGAFDVYKLLVQAAVEVGQAVGIEAELGEHRAVQVLDVEPVLDRGAAQLVGLAHACAALDAAAGQPHGEAVSVVVAAGALGILGSWLAAELAAPDDQRLVKQAAPLQVLDQAGDRLVDMAGVLGMIGDDVVVGVPVVVIVRTARVDLIEWTNAMSSPQAARCGKTSEMYLPHWPCW